MPRVPSTPRKDPVPIVQEAGLAPGPVWTGAENLAPTTIQSPYHPARSQSLYRLSYPAHYNLKCAGLNLISSCTWDMRNTNMILVGHSEKIPWKEHMELDQKEIEV
jgi:hypothetical protein